MEYISHLAERLPLAQLQLNSFEDGPLNHWIFRPLLLRLIVAKYISLIPKGLVANRHSNKLVKKDFQVPSLR